MIGALIDVVLGLVVYTWFMTWWWLERKRAIVTTIWIDDELLARFTSNMKRAEVVARSFGVASAKAAKAFEQFAKALNESMERERAAGRW